MSEPLIRRGSNKARDLHKPRRYRTDNTCKGKRRWVSEVEARAVGAIDIEESAGKVLHLWVYRCQHCSGWHLTSKNQGSRWKVTVENPAAADAPAA